jgi:outer membrane protein OmpA-like peptidoglycan-associated protein
MKMDFRRKLLTGVAATALIVLVGAGDARAQAPAPQPYSFDLFLQGGRAFSADNTTPIGQLFTTHQILTADSGNGWNGKIGGSVHFMNVWSAHLTYSGLRAKNTTNTPNFHTTAFPLYSVLGGGFVGSPGIGTSWNREVVKTTTRADILDFQAGYDIGLGGGIRTTLLGGLRFGSFNQETDATLFSFAGAAQATDKRHSRFQGIGPTIGANVAMPLPVAGLGVEGSVLAGALFGEVRSSTAVTFTPPTSPLLPRNFSKDHVSPNVDAELALTYTMPAPGAVLELAAGYQVNFYGGVRDTANGASIFPAQHFGSTTDDLLYHGPFARLKVRFGAPAAPPPVTAPPAPPPVAVAPQKQVFIVFFEFDKSSLTADGRRVVDAAAAAFKTGKSSVAIAGYTDLAGTQQYNLALSKRRADTVKTALVRDGVPAAAIDEKWFGKQNPRVPTADGVREPQNRRVEVTM